VGPASTDGHSVASVEWDLYLTIYHKDSRNPVAARGYLEDFMRAVDQGTLRQGVWTNRGYHEHMSIWR
jgi:hypothetical protein